MLLKSITGFERDQYQNLEKIRKFLPSSLVSSFLVTQLTVQLEDFDLETIENDDTRWLMGKNGDTEVSILYMRLFDGIMIQIRNFITNEYRYVDINAMENHKIRVDGFECEYHQDHGVQLEKESYVVPLIGLCDTVEDYFHEVRCYGPVTTSIWLGSPSKESPYTSYCNKVEALGLSSDYTRTMKASYDSSDGKVHGTLNDEEFSLEKSSYEHFVLLLENKFYAVPQKTYRK